MKKAFFSDIDLTLVPHMESVSSGNLQAIDAYRKAGGHFVLSTGRSYEQTLTVMRDYGHLLPAICCNGAEIYDDQGHLLVRHSLSIDILASARCFAETYHPAVLLFFEDKLRTIMPVDEMIRRFARRVILSRNMSFEEALPFTERIFKGRLYELENEGQLEGHSLLKLEFAFDNKEACEKVMEYYLQDSHLVVARTNDYSLEITSPSATKGQGIRFFLQYYGIDPKDAAVIGDSGNDSSMFLKDVLKFSLENGEPSIKVMADIIVRSCQDDGVAEAIGICMKNE